MIIQILIIATDAGKMLGIRVDKSSTLRKTLSSTALLFYKTCARSTAAKPWLAF
jgi:hypothetical protein